MTPTLVFNAEHDEFRRAGLDRRLRKPFKSAELLAELPRAGA